MLVGNAALPIESRRRYRLLNVPIVAALVVLLLAGLPLAVWFDLRNLSEHALRDQAAGLGSAITNIRNFYSQNVVDRVLSSKDETRVVHNYLEIPGAIPIPATLSIELGRLISSPDGKIQYRFFSDYPFANRATHSFDRFERDALASLRRDPKTPIYESSGSIFDREVRIATPVIMSKACVSCHNAHPQSPKRDWKVGDVRGLQEIIVRQPIAANVFAFKYLLIYLACAAMTGVGLIAFERRQAATIGCMNRQLGESNDFLTELSTKIAKYLPPQLYRGILSGEKDVKLATDRKRLAIFFSDIVDFTATTERLQPEELAALLNEYLTEMSAIAVKHGGTVGRFIGDAMLIFFGDPESKGAAEDTRACLCMAIEMRRRLAELNIQWRRRGVEQPFRVRMGINTGYCNVGNFGSNDRVDYTVIGAEANLAARLQSIAEPGGIVVSYETYALVRDIAHGHPLAPITMKGISRAVVPYHVEGLLQDAGRYSQVISEHAPGLELFLNTDAVDSEGAERARRVLQDALAALDARGAPA
jgi:class 3 adenylate cyclase